MSPNETRENNSPASLLLAAASVCGAYSVLIWWSESDMMNMPGLVAALFLLFLLNFWLHAALCVPGRIRWYVLPLLWGLCVVPLYVASYHIIRPGFFGRDFTFAVLGALTLAPIFVLSLLTSLIWLFAARRRKKADCAVPEKSDDPQN